MFCVLLGFEEESNANVACVEKSNNPNDNVE